MLKLAFGGFSFFAFFKIDFNGRKGYLNISTGGWVRDEMQ
jgi:hypothetical protein